MNRRVWVELELGRPTLGLGQGWTYTLRPTSAFLLFERVGRIRVLVRRVESDTGLDRTGLFVRRALNSNFGSYKNLGLGGQP